MANEKFDVVIVGGSYAGLSAAMGLGRALRSVLVVDSGLPANRYTPESHNFLTQDGRSPAEIASIAKQQVDKYKSVTRIFGIVVNAERSGNGFYIDLVNGTRYHATKLIFATGIVDILPSISGFEACWGRSVLHCPYCHGYEVRNVQTGILGNGDYAFEFGSLLSNWTSDLTIYTNGPSTLTPEQVSRLQSHKISVVEEKIELLGHNNGSIERVVFANGSSANVKALYARPAFKQSSDIPASLGCELTDEGYIIVDNLQRTTIPGIYACGDNSTKMRTVSNAIATGTAAAIVLNKEFVLESF